MENFTKAIDTLAARIDSKVSSGEALQFTQAIANLAHAAAKLKEIEAK